MKVLQSSFFRSLCAIVVGALLIQYREETVRWITILIGVMFFISGVISIVSYYASRRKQLVDVELLDAQGNPLANCQPTFPIVGVGSLVFGVVLAVMPTTFVTGLTIALAAILILGAINQMIALAQIRKVATVAAYYWVLPVLTLLVGIVSVVYPQAIASAPLLFIGLSMMIYGVAECVNAIKIHRERKRIAKLALAQTAEAEAVEVASEPESEQ